MSKFFDPLHISPLSQGASVICAVLTLGLRRGSGTIAVHSSKKGLRITMNNKTICHGKTIELLHADFMVKRSIEQRKASEQKGAAA